MEESIFSLRTSICGPTRPSNVVSAKGRGEFLARPSGAFFKLVEGLSYVMREVLFWR
jgi:hypothetical protein